MSFTKVTLADPDRITTITLNADDPKAVELYAHFYIVTRYWLVTGRTTRELDRNAWALAHAGQSTEKITLTNAHGTFTTDGYGLDRVIARYLPASPNDLRAEMAEINPDGDYSDVRCVGEFLVMLADCGMPHERHGVCDDWNSAPGGPRAE